LIEVLASGGRYAEAAKMYQLLKDPHLPQDSQWMAPYAAFSAIVAGRSQLADQILSDQNAVLTGENLDGIFQGFRDAESGNPINAQQFLVPDLKPAFSKMWQNTMIACCEAKAGTSKYHDLFMASSFWWPMTRFYWVIQDDYQRRDPSQDAGAFYEYLAWFFGSDPWVAKAVADYRKRGGQDQRVDPDMLQADLKQGLQDGLYQLGMNTKAWSHVLTTWRVVACAHQLLKENRSGDAAEIADMFKKYESAEAGMPAYSVACELVRKVAEWKAGN
jgi:hypothetical protein